MGAGTVEWPDNAMLGYVHAFQTYCIFFLTQSMEFKYVKITSFCDSETYEKARLQRTQREMQKFQDCK
jgi:hypothetical protein